MRKYGMYFKLNQIKSKLNLITFTYMNPKFPNKLEYPISNLYNGNVNMYKVSKKKVTRKNGWHFMFRFCLDVSFRRILWALLHYDRNFQISSEKYDAFSHLDYRIVASSGHGVLYIPYFLR